MHAKTKERWQELSQLAADERDPHTFAVICDELLQLLQEKRLRLAMEHSTVPVCSICAKAVELETCKTDEKGKAVHESCYESKIAFDKAKAQEG